MPDSPKRRRRKQGPSGFAEISPHPAGLAARRNFSCQRAGNHRGHRPLRPRHGPWTIRFEPRDFDAFTTEMAETVAGRRHHRLHRQKPSRRKCSAPPSCPWSNWHGDPKYGAAQVQCDDAAMGCMAVEHFLDRGLRHFGHFAYGETWWIEVASQGILRRLENALITTAISTDRRRRANASGRSGTKASDRSSRNGSAPCLARSASIPSAIRTRPDCWIFASDINIAVPKKWRSSASTTTS